MSSADNGKTIRNRLAEVGDFLKTQSAFDGDSLSWAGKCIAEFLDGRKETLDHAFGFRSSKRGPKPMKEGNHDDWVASALFEVGKKTRQGHEWPNTKTLAEIGRYFGLGGKNNKDTEDHAIASELKRILIRYRSIIEKQVSDELTEKMCKPNA